MARPARRRGRRRRRRDRHAAHQLGSICTLPPSVDRCVRPRRRRPADRRVREFVASSSLQLRPGGHHRRRLLHVRHARRARPVRAASTRRPSAAATARRSTSACGPPGSGCATWSRTRPSCTTAAACRSATSRASGWTPRLGAASAATGSSGRPTAVSGSVTRWPCRSRRSSSALVERDHGRPHVLHVLHGPPEATRAAREKHLAALLERARRRVRLLRPVPGRGRLRPVARVLGGLDGAHGRAEFLLPGAGAGDALDDAVAAEALMMPRSTSSTSTRCTSTT